MNAKLKENRYPEEWYDIDTDTYDWSVKAFRTLKKLLRVNMTLYGDDQVKRGDIFLFNHFSRFETFIPQFLIHLKSGAYCCAIASSEFFEADGALQYFLKKVGVVPHDHPRLFPILAEQILRGRKVIIFPEGGMVKDRRVLDHRGEYSIFSRLSGERRKHHTGAAVLAQGLEVFKAMVRSAYAGKQYERMERWREQLQFDTIEQLWAIALKPTLIVPANITFYPIRTTENLLHQAIKLFARDLSARDKEELLVEGNILLKDTDMDLRLGRPIDPFHGWSVYDRLFLEAMEDEFEDLDAIFLLYDVPRNLKQKLLRRYLKNSAKLTRNVYMEQIYLNVTINLSHLASTLIIHCACNGWAHIGKKHFYNVLYAVIKRLQLDPEVYLHHSLLNPNEYETLPDGEGQRLEQFIDNAESSGLVVSEPDVLRFLPKLCREYDFDSVRMENSIVVYCNEAEPIGAVHTAVVEAWEQGSIDPKQLAAWFFDDELRSLAWAKQYYSQPQFDEVNRKEIATADSSPFLLRPEDPNGIGVLLIHGLLANPAEMQSLGDHLTAQGYTVMAVRLKGHGTSPYDLREQPWQAWFASVQKGYRILRAYCEHIAAIGFATGGALALQLSAVTSEPLTAVVAAAVPLKFVNPAFMLLPLLQTADKVLDWTPPFEGIQGFIENEAEHPQINYRNVPISCLFELRKMIRFGEGLWPKITTPVLLLHAERDPVVDVESSKILIEILGGTHNRLELIDAEHHGILMDNSGGCWATIDAFLLQNA